MGGGADFIDGETFECESQLSDFLDVLGGEFRDEVSRALTSLDEAFGFEAGECFAEGGAVDAKTLGPFGFAETLARF